MFENTVPLRIGVPRESEVLPVLEFVYVVIDFLFMKILSIFQKNKKRVAKFIFVSWLPTFCIEIP